MKNPDAYVFGKWSGVGRMLNISLDREMGEIPIEIEISQQGIQGSVGMANIKRATLKEERYGYSVEAVLDTVINPAVDLDKDRFVLLLVQPKDSHQVQVVSDANFHLKSNFFFDFTMRVGGVMLKKERSDVPS